MSRHIKQRNSPCRNKIEGSGEQRARARSERRGATAPAPGYALLVVMAVAVLLLVSLTAALPSIFQEAQREREQELIFRGIQYARAIALFHRQFQRFPTNVKELLQTNGMRFLRQAYPDPMDRKGKWRFIHANAAGGLLDSKIQGAPNAPKPFGTPSGTSSSPSGSDNSQSDSQSQASSSSSSGSGSQANSPSSFFSSGSQQSSQSSSAFFGSGNEIIGALIVGVAATSHHESIRKWNNRTHYDEWEFLGVDLNLLGMSGVPGQGGTSGQPPGSTGSGGLSSGPGGLSSGPGGSMFPSSPPGPSTPSPP